MKKILTIIFAGLFIFSCKNQKEDEPVEEILDSTQLAALVVSEDSAVIYSNQMVLWLDETLKTKTKSGTTISLEEYWKQDSFPRKPFVADSKFYSDYNSVLRWSPDSSYVMDFGSYGSVVTKGPDGKVKLEGGEPDTELALIQPGTNQRTRLMFVGPSSRIINAIWTDTAQAMVVGTFDKTGNNKLDTLIWMINVKDNYFRLYNVKKR